MTTIVVAGALANKPHNGGEAWVRLSWLLGLKKLGFQICFLEQIAPNTCIDEAGSLTTFETSTNLAYFKQIVDQFGLTGSAALIYNNGEQIYGMSPAAVLDIARDAGLLVNISGHLTLPAILGLFRLKAYIDIDPGFTQFWYTSGGLHLDHHDFYFTIGENVGSPDCSIPTGNIQWRRTRQPIVLEHWPVSHEGDPHRFTTIASWRGPYGPVQYGGNTFGLKVHEWRKYLELPMRVQQVFEIALNIHPADEKDLRSLHQHGWQIVDPKATVPDPLAFRHYVQRSGCEFSVSQGIYVETRSGWFSDRTIRYLASGKPALVQDTGFSQNYSVGIGLVPFRTLEEAVAGAESIARDYDRHCHAARATAVTYFDSDKVLAQFVDDVGIAP